MAVVRPDLNVVEIEKSLERIKRDFSAKEVVSEVFPEEEQRDLFVQGLVELSEVQNSQIKVGGRRVREMLGITTHDLALDIVSDAEEIRQTLTPDAARLAGILEYLEKYETKRMTEPDLDLFIWDVGIEKVLDIFNQKGFKTETKKVTGGVTVINVKGSNGTATFITGESSWQTKESWPMMGGIIAEFSTDASEPTFKLDVARGRVSLYPLEIGEKIKNPKDPQRFASVGRALLWSLTTITPEGRMINPPGESTTEYILETVRVLPDLLSQIKNKPELEVMYRGALRDIAISLRIILPSDWQGIPEMRKDLRAFYTLIQGSLGYVSKPN